MAALQTERADTFVWQNMHALYQSAHGHLPAKAVAAMNAAKASMDKQRPQTNAAVAGFRVGRREGGKPRARSGQTSEAAGRTPRPGRPRRRLRGNRRLGGSGRSAAIGGAAGSAEPGPVGLPRRAPQASMAPQLRASRG